MFENNWFKLTEFPSQLPLSTWPSRFERTSTDDAIYARLLPVKFSSLNYSSKPYSTHSAGPSAHNSKQSCTYAQPNIPKMWQQIKKSRTNKKKERKKKVNTLTTAEMTSIDIRVDIEQRKWGENKLHLKKNRYLFTRIKVIS